MRTFRRNPKRNDPDDLHQSTADQKPFEALPHITTTSHASFNTPMSSPIMYLNTQFTPPQPPNTSQHISSPSSSTNLSSPKKLLTPIRNLFHSSSNSKSNGNIAATNENLNNVLYSSPTTTSLTTTSVTPTSRLSKGFRGHKKGNNSIGSLQLMESEPAFAKPSFTHSQSQLSLHEYNQRGFTHSIGSIYSPSSTGMHLLNDAANNSTTTTAASQNQLKLLPPPMQPYINAKKPMNTIILGSQSSLVSQSASFHSSASGSLSSPIANSHLLPHDDPLSRTHLKPSLPALPALPALPSTSSSLKPPINLGLNGGHASDDDHLEELQSRERSFNDSDISLAPSESHFQTSTTRKVSFKKKPEIFKSNASDDSDLDSDVSSSTNSDTSSQFSFVKDMKGGRNTSLKYYKNTRPKPNQKVVPTFNQHDLNYEVDDYSDYDFENNGMDDDYGGDGDEEEVGYNNAFDDEDEEVGYNNAFDGEHEDEGSGYNDAYDDDDVGYNDDFDDDEEDDIVGYNNAFGDEDREQAREEEEERQEEDYFHTNQNEDSQKLKPEMDDFNTEGNDHEQFLDAGFELYTKSSGKDSNVSKVFESDDFADFELKYSKKEPHSLQRSLPSVQIEYMNLDRGKISSPEFSSYSLPSRDAGSHELFPISDDNANDILETYLDTSNLPYGSKSGSGLNSYNSSRSPEEKAEAKYPKFVISETVQEQNEADGDNLKLFDINSPLINGVTIGNNLRHRTGRSETLEGDTAESKRKRSLKETRTDISKNTFIHREQHNEGKELSDKEIYQNRVYKSFHASISDEFENFDDKLDNSRKPETRTEAYKALESDGFDESLGLGILTPTETESERNEPSDSDRKEKVRKSVNDMMDILQQFSNDTEEKGSRFSNKKSSSEGSQQTKRDSILNLMSILEKVEEEHPSKTKDKQKNSILGVMNLLEQLEGGISEKNAQTISSILTQIEQAGKVQDLDESDRNEKSKKEKFNTTNRNSINDMMATLASFNIESEDFSSMEKRRNRQVSQLHDSKNSTTPPVKKEKSISSQNQIPKSKRYSWFGDDESSTFNNQSGKSGSNLSGLRNEYTSESKGNDDMRTFVFDESVIDEINQLPEDFDFEEYLRQNNTESQSGQTPGQATSFYRSNSYNKKPIRAGVDNTFQSNKIETLNKTVTIYRSASPLNSDLNRSHSVSRAPSTRSSASFISINEGDAEDVDDSEQRDVTAVDRTKEYSRKLLFIDEDLKSPTKRFLFENKSCDSISRNSFSLGTITEAESPSLK